MVPVSEATSNAMQVPPHETEKMTMLRGWSYLVPWCTATAGVAWLSWWLGRSGGPATGKGEEGGDIGEVLALWFDGTIAENYKTKWFCPEGSPQQEVFDGLISKRFDVLLEQARQGILDHWRRSPRGLLALIVLLDQFPRHIYRHDKDRGERLRYTDAMALSATQELRDKGWARELTVPQLVFGLMPLRHSPSVEGLRLVIGDIDARLEEEEKGRELLARFRKTTLRRMQGLEGEVPEDAEILEHFSFVADESHLGEHPVARSMASFLQSYVKERGGLKAVAVSLSGGVDSMVIAKCLAHFKPRFGFNVVALHIDYANRLESGREADYVEAWCEKTGLVFRKRVVSEVTRGVTARDEYEKVSREIRFAFYEEVLAEFACPAIMFGHHQGDLQENVISNVMRGCGPLQLSGMARESVINQVTVWRPLLDHTKDAIFDFAHTFGVPYFKDTTPTWSTRGKLRRHLLPLLADMYGDGFKANLSSLAHQSDEVRDVINATLLDPFLDSVQWTPMASHVDVAPYKQQSVFFWREVLRIMAHRMGQGKLTDKGVAQLRRHIMDRPFTTREFWFELRRDYAVLLIQFRLFIFRPGVIHSTNTNRQQQHPHPHGLLVPLDQPVTAGPWRIHATTYPDHHRQQTHGDDCEEGGINAPVFKDAIAFCQGSFSYRLALSRCHACGSWPLLRVMDEGYKGLLPWQQVELRIKRSVPVVAPVCQVCDGARLDESGGADGGDGAAGRTDQPGTVVVSYRYVGQRARDEESAGECDGGLRK